MVANDLRLRESETSDRQPAWPQAGYRTGFIGKWHLDGGPRMPGFIPPGPRRHGFQFWAANECSHTHFNTQYFRDTAEPIPVHKFEAEAWTDIALDFMKDAIAALLPDRLDGSAARSLSRSAGVRDACTIPRNCTCVPTGRLSTVAGSEGDRPILRQREAVDEQIGRLAAAADDNTIVLLSSDHGDMLGSQGRRLKRKPWEESIRVPGIFRCPSRIKAGSRSDAIFTHVDFAPTFLGLCGVKAPARMQGRDSFSSDSGARIRRTGPDSAFFQIFGRFRATARRTGGAACARIGTCTHDSRPSPGCFTTSKGSVRDEQPGGRCGLWWRKRWTGELAAWMKRTGDSWKLDWHELVEDKGRLYTGGDLLQRR